MAKLTENEQSRRAFMKRIAQLTATAALAGVSVTPARAEATPTGKLLTPRGRKCRTGLAFDEKVMAGMKGAKLALAETMNEALATHDMKGALAKFGTGLLASDRELLGKLGTGDLKALGSILGKLKSSIPSPDGLLAGHSGGFFF
jgi:hypothetical protein